MSCEFYGYSCEGIGALVSAVIALLALGATLRQASVTRKHNRLSVKPMLSTWNHSDVSQNKYEVQLKNIGIGPALINTFEIFVDGKKVGGEGTEPIDRAIALLFPLDLPTILYRSYLAKGGALGEKESIIIVAMQFAPGKLPDANFFQQLKERVKLLVTYKSIYEDQIFTYDSIKNHQS